jgi:hypothetical protein
MCEERARMLQEQFGVTVNHVHALSILISIFHFEKNPSAIDQVTISSLLRCICYSSVYVSPVLPMQRQWRAPGILNNH